MIAHRVPPSRQDEAWDDDPDLDDPFLRGVARLKVPANVRPLPMPRVGDLVGGHEGTRFELTEVLGVGSMGIVFRARDHLLERQTAIKFVLRNVDLSTDHLFKLFVEEAKATARLDHDNIVRIFDLDRWNGLPFLVMEYLVGDPLYAILQRERVAPRRAVEIMCHAVRGLAHAHGQEIVHRDLKPSNVFVLADGRVKILDFGISRPIEPAGDVGVRPVSGTPSYMAPEQWRGLAQDGRTDIWAVGCILFEMLAGERPLQEDDPARLGQRVSSSEPMPLLGAFRTDLPDLAEQVLARALAKRPEDRFQNAGDLLDALLHLGDEIRRTAPGPAGRLARADGGPEPSLIRAATSPIGMHDRVAERLAR